MLRSEETIGQEEKGYFAYLSSCLIYAIKLKDTKTIQSILNDASRKNIAGEVNLARYLLKKTDEQGKTLLHLAASIRDNTEVINILCETAKKHSIIQFSSQMDNSGSTAGHYAIESGSINNFQILLAHGLNPTIKKFFTQETLKDIINSKYANDKNTYLLFMNALVLSPKGKEYFSARHHGISPDQLTEETLFESLKIDKIVDNNEDLSLQCAALNYCFAQLEKEDISDEEINLFISHMHAVESPDEILHPAIDIALLFDKQHHFTIISPLLKKLFVTIQVPAISTDDFYSDSKSTALEKERTSFIETNFLLNLAQYSKNKNIIKIATNAAFGKCLKIKNPALAFSGLKQLKSCYMQEQAQEIRCLYVTALVNNFLKIMIIKEQSNIIQSTKKQNAQVNFFSNFFKDSHTLVYSLMFLYILEFTYKTFENLIDINTLSIILDEIDLIPDNFSIDSFKKIITFDYLSSICTGHFTKLKCEQITQAAVSQLYKKTLISSVTKIKSELSQLLQDLKIIPSAQKELVKTNTSFIHYFPFLKLTKELKNSPHVEITEKAIKEMKLP